MWLELNDELYNLDRITYIAKKNHNISEDSIEYVIYLDNLYIRYDNENERNNDYINIKMKLKTNKKYLKL
jgi:hypothetical protein